MIKIENDIFYMSAGETCYVLKNVGGKLKHVYFGKRVEPEDDLSALGGTYGDEFECATLGGKPTDFVLDSAEVLAKKPSGDLMLSGGKTLKIVLRDKKNALKAEILYTPYSRGGFSRSTIVYNESASQLSLGMMTQSIVQIGSPVKTEFDGFKVTGIADCNDRVGEAYGFLCPYLDGKIELRDGYALCEQNAGKLAPGKNFRSAEMLAVYSDHGFGGMSRVFHDILRECLGYEYQSTRRSQTALFLPSMPCEKVKAAAANAYELGCDVMAVDFGEYEEREIAQIAEACRAVGISPGLRVNTDGIKKPSAACVAECKPLGTGYFIDKTDENAASSLMTAVERVVRENGIRYVLTEFAGSPKEKALAAAVYRMCASLRADMPEVCIEWGNTIDPIGKNISLCFPPCVLRAVVRPSKRNLKQAFDRATFGALAYEFDPASVSDDIKRAVRAQIFSYQDDAPIVMNGDLYLLNGDGFNKMSVTKDKSKAYAVCTTRAAGGRVRLYGLDEHNLYHVREKNKTFSGAALMYYGIDVPASEEQSTVAFHIRQVADYE